MTAFNFGQYVLPALIGLVLLLVGLLRRRRSSVAVVAPIEALDQVPVPEPKGTPLIWTGVALLAMSALVDVSEGVKALQGRADVAQVKIVMPQGIDGMQRHDEYFPEQIQQARTFIPPKFDEDVAWYGSAFGGVLVIAGRGSVSDPAYEAKQALAAVADAAKVLTPGEVTTLEGEAVGCSKIAPKTTSALTRFFCVSVNKASIVTTSDGDAITSAQAEARIHEVRRQVVVKSSLARAPRAPSPTSVVTITAPKALLGATRADDVIVAERKAFRTQMAQFTKQADTVAYRYPDGAQFLITAAAGDMSWRPSFLRYFRASVALDIGKDPGPPTNVPPGAGGGNGYCWKVVIEGDPAVVCALVDDQSFVALYEFNSGDVTATVGKVRQVRALVRKGPS